MDHGSVLVNARAAREELQELRRELMAQRVELAANRDLLKRRVVAARGWAGQSGPGLRYSTIAHLRAQLESMPVIEQAKGILMCQTGCSPEEAFELLRRASQRTNIKVRDLAGQIVGQAQADGTVRRAHQGVRPLGEQRRYAARVPALDQYVDRDRGLVARSPEPVHGRRKSDTTHPEAEPDGTHADAAVHFRSGADQYDTAGQNLVGDVRQPDLYPLPAADDGGINQTAEPTDSR